MKKGDKNRGDILLQKLIRGSDFQYGVKKIRIAFDIPINGYTEMLGIGCWYSKRMDITKEETSAMRAFMREIEEFLIAQALPAGTWWQHKIIEYILSDGKMAFLFMPPGVEPFVEMISKPNPTRKGSFTDLRIYEGATQRDIKDFLAHHGRLIKPSYRIGTHKQIRKEKDFSDNDRAVGIYDLPKKERRRRAGTNNAMFSTKEVEVGRILRGMKINKTGDAVKAVKYRRRKNKR